MTTNPFKVVTRLVEFPVKNAVNHEGHYIGEPEFAKTLVEKYGITRFELRTSKSQVCSIGFNEKTKTWYGWSHRAIRGFKTRAAAAAFAESVS